MTCTVPDSETSRRRGQRFGGAGWRVVNATRRSVHRFVLAVRATWRQSLQVRVVATTLLLSSVVTLAIGFMLMYQVQDGLLDAQQRAAYNDHQVGLNTALNELQNTDQPERELDDITADLTARSGATGLYEVAILSSQDDMPGRISGGLTADTVPDRLREEVQASELRSQFHTYAALSEGGETTPALVVGARLSTAFELYYVFPLTAEQEMLQLVERTMIGAAFALILLLAAIASLVTRQVVTPVREAARSAERLSSGDLAERMQVRGEDDLARLAESFNDMAWNLQEKIQELEELSKVQRQFVSDVSHELRTPLTTIRMAGDLLYDDRDELDPTMARSVELLQSQLQRFEELLADLLEISRHDAGAVTLSVETADLRDLVMEAAGDAEQLAERRGITIQLRLPAEPCTADVDVRRINRILRNLIVNAVEHSENKDIVVAAAADAHAVAVAVRDFGVGLREEEAQLCFDRFWRADPARTRTTGGTGLGLSIAKEDAQLHGGWLQAWGSPGKGSQFRLSLPRTHGSVLEGSPLPLAPPEISLTQPASSYQTPVQVDVDATPSRTGEEAQ
uniref:MtrAB system histidine kinase MtrB n=1 Tax=Spiractinospora alimapuensis TaxID=2820884 RepID=UPI0037436DC7